MAKTTSKKRVRTWTVRVVIGICLVVAAVAALYLGRAGYKTYSNYKQQETALAKLDMTATGSNQELKGSKSNIDLQNQQLKVIAAVVIPKIKVTLPVFSTDTDAALDIGAGLMSTKSPVGGVPSHTVLAGHTGKYEPLFDDVPQLQRGDPIYLRLASGKTLEYKVTSKTTRSPRDDTDLQIEPGKDLLTLYTCYPYPQLTHRMHVHAKRVAYDGRFAVAKPWFAWIFDHAALLGSLLAAALVVLLTWIYSKRKEEKRD